MTKCILAVTNLTKVHVSFLTVSVGCVCCILHTNVYYYDVNVLQHIKMT